LFLLVRNNSNVASFTILFHVHRQANWCSEMFFWKRCVRRLFKTLRHLQSFVAVFNEQVEIIKKSNAGLWNRSPTSLGWLDLEPKLFRGWSWSLKFRLQFHRYSFVKQASFTNIILEQEPKTSRCCIRRQKVKYLELDPEPEI